MKVNIIYEKSNLENYNVAVTDVNHAADTFNSLAEFRNHEDLSQGHLKHIDSLLQYIDNNLAFAQKKLTELDRSPANEQYNTETLHLRLNSLFQKLEEEKILLKP